jgi:hypothetical protein
MKKVSKVQKLYVILLLVVLASGAFVSADAPLPLQDVQGNSGILFTPTAYLANPPKEGDFFGLPSFAAAIGFMHDKDFQSYGVTWNLGGRLELGYAFNRLGLGDFTDYIGAAGLHVDNHVKLHNFNVRYMVVQEGDFDTSWMPAITVGGHFKWFENYDQIEKQLNGTLDSLGADNDFGTDLTVFASKTITDVLPNPMILTVGLRNTDAIQMGLLGFSGERETVVEGSIVYFLTEKLALAAEYKQKPNGMHNLDLGGREVIRAENDWWDILLAYIVNDHFTVAGGYVNYGNVLNSNESCGWALQLKYEF